MWDFRLLVTCRSCYISSIPVKNQPTNRDEMRALIMLSKYLWSHYIYRTRRYADTQGPPGLSRVYNQTMYSGASNNKFGRVHCHGCYKAPVGGIQIDK